MLLKLLRVHQWYKNFAVFLIAFAVFFSLPLKSYFILFLTFIAFSLMSSANYIINDIIDRHRDKTDPVKRKRPIASGQISVNNALLISFILFFISLAIAYFISLYLLILLLLFFIITQAYSLYFKKKVFFDIVFISFNFFLRAMGGAIALSLYISAWFLLIIFFIAMFLVSVKRWGEARDKIVKNRPLLKYYDAELMQIFSIFFMLIIIVIYSMYIILNTKGYYITSTVPLVSLVFLRYFMLVRNNNDLARHAEKALFRMEFVFAFLLWLLLVFLQGL